MLCGLENGEKCKSLLENICILEAGILVEDLLKLIHYPNSCQFI